MKVRNYSDKIKLHLRKAIQNTKNEIKLLKDIGSPDIIVENAEELLRELQSIYNRYFRLTKKDKEYLKKLERKYIEQESKYYKNVYR